MIDYPEYFSYKEWMWVIPAAVIVWLAFAFGQGLNIKKYQISPLFISFVISNLFFLTILLTFESRPTSDWSPIWIAANQMAEGEFTDGLIKGTYMHEIPYQLGFAFVQSLVIRCFGSNYEVIRGLNLILMNLMIFCVYHFALRKTGKHVACFAMVSSSVFLSWTMTIGIMTNHQIGFILLYLSLYLFEKGKPLPCVLSGVSLACLHFVRPMSAIVIATIVCYSVFLFIKGKCVKRLLSNIVIFYLSFAMVCYMLDSMLLGLGYIDERMSQSSRNIYHKISYTTYDSKIDGHIADFNYDYEAYNNAYKEEMIDMIQHHPLDVVKGVTNKICRYLGLLDYGFEFTYNHDEAIWQKYPIRALYSIQWFQYVFYLVIAIYGYIKYRKTHESDLYQIFFIGNNLVYIFVEAFSTYRFENYFYLLFLVGFGMNEFANNKSVSSRMSKKLIVCQ